MDMFERIYDLDGDGKLDLIEEAMMFDDLDRMADTGRKHENDDWEDSDDDLDESDSDDFDDDDFDDDDCDDLY